MFILGIILFIILLICIQVYNSKIYKPCKKCTPNEYFIFDVKQPPSYYKEELYNQLKNGTQLKNEKNFNTVQGVKIDKNKIPKEIKEFFLNEELREKVGELVGENVDFADDIEKYKIFARLYEHNGDHIDWHYDNNYTAGNRYTLVIPIIQDVNNTSEFVIKDQKTQKEITVSLKVGQGVVYNGTVTYHKITPQTNGAIRMVVIIPFYSNKNMNVFNRVQMNVRNILYKNLTL